MGRIKNRSAKPWPCGYCENRGWITVVFDAPPSPFAAGGGAMRCPGRHAYRPAPCNQCGRPVESVDQKPECNACRLGRRGGSR